MDEALHGALTERALGPLDGFGHEAPAQRLGEHVGGDLAPEEPAGEVPQRPLALERLVHGQQLLSLQAAGHEQRRVRAPGDAPVDLHVTLEEDALDLGVRHRR